MDFKIILSLRVERRLIFTTLPDETSFVIGRFGFTFRHAEIGRLFVPACYQNRNGSIVIFLNDQRFSKSCDESAVQSHR